MFLVFGSVRVLPPPGGRCRHHRVCAPEEAMSSGMCSRHWLQTSGQIIVLCATPLTHQAGIHTDYGGFVLGAVTPHNSWPAREPAGRLHDVVMILQLPAYLAVAGLSPERDRSEGSRPGRSAWISVWWRRWQRVLYSTRSWPQFWIFRKNRSVLPCVVGRKRRHRPTNDSDFAVEWLRVRSICAGAGDPNDDCEPTGPGTGGVSRQGPGGGFSSANPVIGKAFSRGWLRQKPCRRHGRTGGAGAQDRSWRTDRGDRDRF